MALLNLPLPKRTMLVAREDGRLYQVDFTEHPELEDPALIDWDLSVSKLLVGKFQLTRTRFVTVEELEFENVTRTAQVPEGATGDLETTLYHTLDGRNVEDEKVLVPSIDEGGLVKYNARVTGQNFSVQLRGTYNINTLIFTVHQHGRR